MKEEFALIIPAAGEGRRLGAETSKAFIDLAGLSLLARTMERFDNIPRIVERIVAVRSSDVEQAKSCLERWEVTVVPGGTRRQDSVRAALSVVKSAFVAVHDAARPFVSRDIVEQILDETTAYGAAIAAAPVTDTIKRVAGQTITETLPRDVLWAAQTPQAFKTDILLSAFESFDNHQEATDDARLVEAAGVPVRIISSGSENLKITTPEDLKRAREMLLSCLQTRENGPNR